MAWNRNKIELVHKDLSFEIVGALFAVYNELGVGHAERVYGKALEKEFEQRKITFVPQRHCGIRYSGGMVGNYFPDFVIDGKIVLELKVKARFSKCDFDQVKKYLKVNDYKLGILASFCSDGVKFARVLNIFSEIRNL